MKATDYIILSVNFAIVLACQFVLLFVLGNLYFNPSSTFTIAEPNKLISGVEFFFIMASVVFVLVVFWGMFMQFKDDLKRYLEERY